MPAFLNPFHLSTRRFIATVLLLTAVVILFRAILPLIQQQPIVIQDQVRESRVMFRASPPAAFFQSDACIDLTWETDGIREIFFNGRGTIGAHTETRCIAEHGIQPAWLRVHFGRDVWKTYRIHYVTLSPNTIIYMVVLTAIAAWGAFSPVIIPPRLRPYLWIVPVLLPLGYLLITDWLSIEFGWHWDEYTLINQVRRTIEEGTFIPDFYNYPSLSYTLVLFSLLSNPKMLFSGDPVIIDQITRENQYLPFARTVFLIFSALAVLWVYVMVWSWHKRVLPALFAASLLAVSWEVSYHLRWIAPDGLLMSAGALTLLLTVNAHRNPSRGWLFWGAVIAAGLGVGSKYPGGLLIVPVFITAVLRWWGKPLTHWITRLLLMGVVFVGTYLITTPGTLLAFDAFWTDILHEMQHYGADGQGYYTVKPGLTHLAQLLAYLGLVAFSKYNLIAAFFTLLVLIGAVSLIRDDWRLALILLSFPVLYVAYFSTQSLLYVRNMLVTLPFWAVLAANGAFVVWRRLRLPALQWVFVVFIAALLTVNAVWMGYAARTIMLRGMHRDAASFFVHAEATPDTTYWAAEGLFDQMIERYGDIPQNIVPYADDADMLAVYLTDNLLVYDTNFGAYLGLRLRRPYRGEIEWFNPMDVNLNYYPGWDGDNRIVLVPIEYVAEWKLQFAPDD